MANYDVLAPFSGDTDSKVVASNDCDYCDGSVHDSTFMYCPVDVGMDPDTQNVSVKFYGSTNIKSIRAKRISGVCPGYSPPTGYGFIQDGVKVELYCAINAQGPLIGEVVYGHLKDIPAEITTSGKIYNASSNILLGKTGPVPSPIPNCYKTIHVHMERSSGTTRNPLSCGALVNTGFWIYRFTGPDICPV